MALSGAEPSFSAWLDGRVTVVAMIHVSGERLKGANCLFAVLVVSIRS